MKEKKPFYVFKIGAGSNTPKKFKPCHYCHQSMKDYRFFIDGKHVCVKCMVESYRRQTKWYHKFISLVFSETSLSKLTWKEDSEPSPPKGEAGPKNTDSNLDTKNEKLW